MRYLGQGLAGAIIVIFFSKFDMDTITTADKYLILLHTHSALVVTYISYLIKPVNDRIRKTNFSYLHIYGQMILLADIYYSTVMR